MDAKIIAYKDYVDEKINELKEEGLGSSSDYKIEKVTALPETPEPNTIYIVIE